MGLYAEYTKERENFETIESEFGFVDYKVFNQECYIRNIYVAPDHRRTSLASDLADKVAEIAKSAGCKYLTGTVVSSTNGSTASVKLILSCGFKILRSEVDKIVFIKEIV